jgi:hypothetical protein
MKLNCKTIIITVALRTLPIIGKINITVEEIIYNLLWFRHRGTVLYFQGQELFFDKYNHNCCSSPCLQATALHV